MRLPRPPLLASWIVRRLSDPYRREALLGDLAEQYCCGCSRMWYWREALAAVVARIWPSHRMLRASLLQLGKSLHPREFGRYAREYRGLAAFLILMLGFRSAWADWVYVPSGSMNPTILEGDRVLVDKHAYGLRVPWTLVHLTPGQDPTRGDIIVFDSPKDGTSLVKRVVAVPGDTIALDNERLTVNGIRAGYAPGDAAALDRLVSSTRTEHPRVVTESGIVGVTHNILLLPDRWAPSTFGPLVVPPGEYFVLGDNRDNSADSRYIGFVPRRNIVGRATRVIVSLDPDRYYLPRRGRFFESLY